MRKGVRRYSLALFNAALSVATGVFWGGLIGLIFGSRVWWVWVLVIAAGAFVVIACAQVAALDEAEMERGFRQSFLNRDC